MFNTIKSSICRSNIRLYSTEANDSLFLSDLLKRIDRISAKSKSIISENKLNKPSNRFSNASTKKDNKVQVADHPLASNSFKQSDRRFSGNRANSSTEGFKGNRQQRDNRQVRDNRQSKENKSTSNVKASRPPRRESTPRTTRYPKRSSNKVPEIQPIKSKALKFEALEPYINGNTFLYGKSTTVNACLTSRVASVTKEVLIESNYPFNLPKQVIENLDDTPRNRFLLQKNFSLDVNQDSFNKRINEVVKGKWDELRFNPKDFKDEKSLSLAEFSKNELMKNGDLSLSHKQTIFDLASGLKSPKQLVEGAHWVKN